MKTLNDIAVEKNYITDKMHTNHNYFYFIYENVFSEIRDTTKLVCEIGTMPTQGATLACNSQRIWRDYFHNAEILALDINLNWGGEDTDMERITLKYFDQSDREQIKNMSNELNNYDVILDDGSHKMFDQQVTFANLFRSLRPGGVYVLEDLHTSKEAGAPDKQAFPWGSCDPNKTKTLDMLEEFNQTGKIVSDYMTEDEMQYLNENIDAIKIVDTGRPYSITSIILKKD